MRLLVCGSRTWTDEDTLYQMLDGIHESRTVTLLIHGGARGADKMAGEWAATRGIPVRVYHARWDVDGRAAGPMRNQRMLVEGQPEEAAAFAVDLSNSKGTKDMVRRLGSANVPTYIVNIPTQETAA